MEHYSIRTERFIWFGCIIVHQSLACGTSPGAGANAFTTADGSGDIDHMPSPQSVHRKARQLSGRELPCPRLVYNPGNSSPTNGMARNGGSHWCTASVAQHPMNQYSSTWLVPGICPPAWTNFLHDRMPADQLPRHWNHASLQHMQLSG